MWYLYPDPKHLSNISSQIFLKYGSSSVENKSLLFHIIHLFAYRNSVGSANATAYCILGKYLTSGSPWGWLSSGRRPSGQSEQEIDELAGRLTDLTAGLILPTATSLFLTSVSLCVSLFYLGTYLGTVSVLICICIYTL